MNSLTISLHALTATTMLVVLHIGIEQLIFIIGAIFGGKDTSSPMKR
jgi:hypothetical protein